MSEQQSHNTPSESQDLPGMEDKPADDPFIADLQARIVTLESANRRLATELKTLSDVQLSLVSALLESPLATQCHLQEHLNGLLDTYGREREQSFADRVDSVVRGHARRPSAPIGASPPTEAFPSQTPEQIEHFVDPEPPLPPLQPLPGHTKSTTGTNALRYTLQSGVDESPGLARPVRRSGSGEHNESGESRRRKRRHRQSAGQSIIVTAVLAGTVLLSVPAYFLLTNSSGGVTASSQSEEKSATHGTMAGSELEQSLRIQFIRFATPEYGLKSLQFTENGAMVVQLPDNAYGDKAAVGRTAEELVIAYKNYTGISNPIQVEVRRGIEEFLSRTR